MKPPRISGAALTALRVLAESTMGGGVIRRTMRESLRINGLTALPDSWRGDLSIDARPLVARPPRTWGDGALGSLPVRSWPRSSGAFAAAYRDGSASPVAVAERALRALDELAARKPTMNIAVARDPEATLRDARASAARHAAGRALGPLDGVPFLVKDEFDVQGLVTTLGSRCNQPAAATRDATVVERLRSAGAVVVCKTVLTEWGMSPLGPNMNQIIPHNAHHERHAPGGSSTGSAVGVALGVAPIAAGGDGGGSIRIPAAFNGVFGLKPTFGRVSRAGDGFKGSVAHAGPIGCSTADLVLFLDAVASTRDADDALTGRVESWRGGGVGLASPGCFSPFR